MENKKRNLIRSLFTIVLGITILTICNGQDSITHRTYEFNLYNNFDLRNSSTNMISAFRLINDGFNQGVASKMNPKVGNIVKGLFNFTTVYLTMLWSHEIGHLLRARQVGGSFNIHNFRLPVPYTTADLPSSISLIDEAIFSAAGFEVNYINIRTLQSQFIRQNGLRNEDLALSFANRLMYPIYTTLIVPIDPNDRNVWINTAGDPVHYLLPVFKKYSNNQVFMSDGKVNPDLVKLYNQSTFLASFFQLLDPQFYREAGAAFGKASKHRRPVFLIGDYSNGWTYGTLFNASPLGYELYLQNYIHHRDNHYGFYIKYGRPFKNFGLGFLINDAIKYRKLTTDILLETWQQDLFGNGISAEFKGQWKMSNRLAINFLLGYKTKGYLLGKQLNSGLNIGTGICLYNK